jgi:hypothetical protein
MSENKAIEVVVDISSAPREFAELARRVSVSKKPDPKDLAELRKWLDKTPELYKSIIDIGKAARMQITTIFSDRAFVQAGIEANAEVLQRDLGCYQASPLERLLIADVVNCWLRLQWVDIQWVAHSNLPSVDMRVIDFWESRLSLAHARYLKACETLARIRKLNPPTLQVNIAQPGSQQLNVAGDLKSEKKDT